MLKRYQVFLVRRAPLENDFGKGGKEDIFCEVDTIQDALELMSAINIIIDDDEVYWLDLQERRWSTEKEEAQFIIDQRTRYQQQRKPYVQDEFVNMHGGLFNYKPEWSGHAIHDDIIIKEKVPNDPANERMKQIIWNQTHHFKPFDPKNIYGPLIMETERESYLRRCFVNPTK